MRKRTTSPSSDRSRHICKRFRLAAGIMPKIGCCLGCGAIRFDMTGWVEDACMFIFYSLLSPDALLIRTRRCTLNTHDKLALVRSIKQPVDRERGPFESVDN